MPAGYSTAFSTPCFAMTSSAGRPFEVLGADRLGLVGLVGIARTHLAQHLLERPGPVRHVEPEARFAVEHGDPVPGEDDLLALAVAHREDGPVREFTRQVAGERVPRLVAVGVAVEESEVGHGRLLFR